MDDTFPINPFADTSQEKSTRQTKTGANVGFISDAGHRRELPLPDSTAKLDEVD